MSCNAKLQYRFFVHIFHLFFLGFEITSKWYCAYQERHFRIWACCKNVRGHQEWPLLPVQQGPDLVEYFCRIRGLKTDRLQLDLCAVVYNCYTIFPYVRACVYADVICACDDKFRQTFVYIHI